MDDDDGRLAGVGRRGNGVVMATAREELRDGNGRLLGWPHIFF
jgi:hypothetical protein